MKEGGYIHIQSTKPLTLSYAMTDSPLGVAAWIFEKMKTWSDNKGDPWTAFTRDEVLDNIMVYLVTNTFGTASWMYTRRRGAGPARATQPDRQTDRVAHFPGELVFWPKSYAERQFKTDPVDRHAPWRPFRGNGAAGTVLEGRAGVR